MDDVEASVVTLTVGDDTNTTHVTATSDHGDGAGVELDELGDLTSGKINLDGVVDLDQRIRVADAARLWLAPREFMGKHTAVKKSSNEVR